FCCDCAFGELSKLLVSREAAKPRREGHKFGGRLASRGRESAGAASGCVSCTKPRMWKAAWSRAVAV
ncbi:MAG: hypothetical protein ACK58J_09530, partial [Planctomyces sp.]